MKATYRNLRVRPRMQREFLSWLLEDRGRFSLRPVIVCRTDRHLDLAFDGITRTISACVYPNGLSVIVEHGGRCFDLLADFDAVAQRLAQGYVCTLCQPGSDVYPTRAALWRGHVFEPFLAWVNDRLAPARWLRLFSLGEDGSSGAALLCDESELEVADPGLLLASRLKNLSNEPMYRPDTDPLKIWVVPLRGNEMEQSFAARLAPGD